MRRLIDSSDTSNDISPIVARPSTITVTCFNLQAKSAFCTLGWSYLNRTRYPSLRRIVSHFAWCPSHF
jgi:hypothetical protein